MMKSEERIAHNSLAFRVGLLGLGLVQLVDGLYALLAPHSFFESFPLGRGWVEALPSYNEHLTRDVGALFIATAVVLIAAGLVLERRLVTVALWSFLAFSVPHTIYHAFNLGPYATGDAIANVLSLGLTVAVPIALLWLMRSPTPRRAAASATAADNARIGLVPLDTRNPLLRSTFRTLRRRYGAVTDPVRAYAHTPMLMVGYSGLELAAERSHAVEERVKHLAELRAGSVAGCEWCMDFGSSISAAAGVSEGDMRELPGFRDSDRFSVPEKLALEYADAMTATPVNVSDELFARLREHFDERQMVELTALISLENMRARFNWALGIESQGYSEGAYCVRPA
jgi:alkylhydroperoxidase family enzyme